MNETPRLTLGPLMYHWPEPRWRDFYFRIADEADIDTVCLGEVVCAKRAPFHAETILPAIERLEAAGKEVVISTLALLTSRRELDEIAELAAGGRLIEANDVTAIEALAGQGFAVGPMVNLFNEATLDFLLAAGATRIALPVELSLEAIGILAAHAPPGATEVQVFGRQTLAIAMRCYHARAYGLHKDACQFVCGRDPDGLPATQMTGAGLVAVDGTATLSHGYLVALGELARLRALGVSRFRLAPQSGPALDMARVAALFRAVAEAAMDPAEAAASLRAMTGEVAWINGYLHARPGMDWVEAA
ncbi:MAG: U32 family peptidase [Rhodospirillales bacterium]|nr:U32 family peptidase [Rhodospirillales bacterium]